MRKAVIILLAFVSLLSWGTCSTASDINVSGFHYISGYYDNNYFHQAYSDPSSTSFALTPRITPSFRIIDTLNMARFDDVGARAWVAESVLPRIKFTTDYGEVALMGWVEKQPEASIWMGQSGTDVDNYIVATLFKRNDFQSGMLYKFISNTPSDVSSGTRLKANVISPYFKASIGKTYVEGQINYLWGEMRSEEAPVMPFYDSRDIDSYSWYLMGKYNIGRGYLGAMYAYVRGDDPDTDDLEGNIAGFGGSADWNPCLILWNNEFNRWMDDMGFNPGSTASYEMTNASLYQVFVGASPVEKLSVSASYTYARANEKQGRLSAEYGQELDLTATYKIFDNLDYMVGFGYLITGDYYKGATDSSQVDNDYLLLNRLTVNF